MKYKLVLRKSEYPNMFKTLEPSEALCAAFWSPLGTFRILKYLDVFKNPPNPSKSQ